MAKLEFAERDRAEARKATSEMVTNIRYIRVFLNEAQAGAGDLMVQVLIEELQKLLPEVQA